MGSLFWGIVAVLIVLWALGSFVVNIGGIVHLLLVVVLILIVVKLVQSTTGRHSHS